MTGQASHHHRAGRLVVLVLSWLVIGMILGVLTITAASTSAFGQASCPAGQRLSENGVTCEPDPNAGGGVCPPGKQLDAAGLQCVEPTPTPGGGVCAPPKVLDPTGLRCVDPPPKPDQVCPNGQQLDAAGLRCVAKPPEPNATPTARCSEGYAVGPDGKTCVVDGSTCARDEVLGDDGRCVQSFRCPAGQILTSDLLGCTSRGCPAGELLSVDGKRCVAPNPRCPDGSPRPVGGACLVVETIDGPDGREVVVRCAQADVFCQAQVKACADGRAASGSDDAEACEDPRADCEPDDDSCEEANERLVSCATRGDEVSIGGADDPCDDLCPELHRLDRTGECVEYLDPKHPCISFGRPPPGVRTNRQLDGYAYLAGTDQCVSRAEFLRRLGNFEAAAGAEADALSLLRETTTAYLTVEDQLAELTQRLVLAEQDVRQFTLAAAEIDANRLDNLKRLESTTKRLAQERAILRGEVLEVYVLGGNDARIESAILSASNITGITVAQIYGASLLDEQITNVTQVDALQERSIELGAELAQASLDVEAALASAVAASQDLDSLVAQTELLREEQLARRDEEAALVSQLRENKASYAQDLGIFEQASREIADIIAESEFLVGEFENCGDDEEAIFASPVIPAEITSGFGPRLHPILGYVRQHAGVDMTGISGQEIYASARGVVTIASSFGGYGNTVVVAHGGELLTLYAHMSAVGAEVGQEVECGDVIGFVGSTGLSTGPHLHFEVWTDGRTAVDPFPYLTQVTSIED